MNETHQEKRARMIQEIEHELDQPGFQGNIDLFISHFDVDGSYDKNSNMVYLEKLTDDQLTQVLTWALENGLLK